MTYTETEDPIIGDAYIEMNRRIVWLSRLVVDNTEAGHCETCAFVHAQAQMCLEEAENALAANGLTDDPVH